jgi:hypothetical protein
MNKILKLTLTKENEKIWNSIENLKDSSLKGESSVDILKCTKCDFKTHSDQGLKLTQRENMLIIPSYVSFLGKLLINLSI